MRLLRSLLRVRLLWVPGVGLAFAGALFVLGLVPGVTDSVGVVLAGFLVAFAVLAAGVWRTVVT